MKSSLTSSEIVVGLDLGTTKVSAVVGEVDADGITILGVGNVPCRGLRKGVVSNTVTAATSNPTAIFTNTPNGPHTTDVIGFDASASTAVLGRVIVTYHWDFSGVFTGSANGATVNIGPIGGGGGTLTVKLTVTDSAGQIGILTRTIQILP